MYRDNIIYNLIKKRKDEIIMSLIGGILGLVADILGSAASKGDQIYEKAEDNIRRYEKDYESLNDKQRKIIHKSKEDLYDKRYLVDEMYEKSDDIRQEADLYSEED